MDHDQTSHNIGVMFFGSGPVIRMSPEFHPRGDGLGFFPG